MQTDATKKVDAGEIWNEHNIDKFQLGYINGNPQNSAEILESASLIIKSFSNASILAEGYFQTIPTRQSPTGKHG